MRAMRACAKPNCSSEAGATMALHYDFKQVLIHDLLEEPDRNLADLCERHVETLRAPLGWEVVDRRSMMSQELEATSS